jgi:ribosomal protein S21
LAKVVLTAHDLDTIRSAEKPAEMANIVLDQMIRRFKKQVINEGILVDYRKHDFFMKKSMKRKEKSKAARKFQKIKN